MQVIEDLSILTEIANNILNSPNIAAQLEQIIQEISSLSPENLEQVQPRLARILEKYKVRAVVNTDGSCYNQGLENAIAGIGVYWGKVTGLQDNTRAELFAAHHAIKQAYDQGFYAVKIRYDSDFVGKVLTRPTDYERPKYHDFHDLIFLITALREHIHISVEYVKAHSGDLGNQEANRLARKATFPDTDEAINMLAEGVSNVRLTRSKKRKQQRKKKAQGNDLIKF